MTFAGIPEEYSSYDSSEILIQSIPYDGTSTWGKGSDRGFERIIEASENMELYDIETESEVYRKGIHVLPNIVYDDHPGAMVKAVYRTARQLIASGKFPTFIGGEHSVSIGVIKAFYEQYPGITILQLDAHADLRPEYDGSPYNHACALHDASKNANLIQVGIRSMDSSERQYMDTRKCFFSHILDRQDNWMDSAIGLMTNEVYITLDLDVFDPGIMPATGTPEPGGLDWDTVVRFLRRVFKEKDVKGFDIVELAPIEGIHSPEFLVAKLYYKMLSYKFKYNE